MTSRPERVRTLERILALARRQCDGMARGDVEDVARLQELRNELAPPPPAREGTEEEKGLAGRILALDRRTLCLLSLRKDAVQEEIRNVANLKKMLTTRRDQADPAPSRFTFRA